MSHRALPHRERRLDDLSQRSPRVFAVAALPGVPAMYVWSSFWQTTTVSNLFWGPISFVLIGATAVGRTIDLDPSLVGPLAISTGVLIPLLPVAALAWIEPDAPADA